MYINLNVSEARNLKYATKTFIHLLRAHAHANKFAKMCANTCCISIYMFLEPGISKMLPKLSYNCSGSMHMEKNCKNVCKIHVEYRFICFWSQEFQNANNQFNSIH